MSKHDCVTVKDLRDFLADKPDDWMVVLEKDAEGNGYSPLADATDKARYVADSTWSGEIFYPDDCEDEDSWGSYYEPEDGVPCILLGPVN